MSSLKSIKEISASEQSALDELFKGDPNLENITKIFKEHFCFAQGDIELCIKNICERTDPEFIENLYKLFYAFTMKDDMSKVERNTRRSVAYGIVNSTLELYDENNLKIYTEFIEVLDYAKKKGIDPYRFAIKTNIAGANLKSFEDTIAALSSEYTDKYTGKKEQLFSEEEVKALIHKCASLAYKVTEGKVKEVLDVLSTLLYDKETNKYILEPKKLIMKVPSLLATNPQDISDSIDFLHDKSIFSIKESDLIERIIASPSLLCVNAYKMYAIKDNLQSSFLRLLYPKSSIVPKEFKIEAEKLAKGIVGNINNLTQLAKVDEVKLDKIAGILSKYLGPQNAITCMHNMTVLAQDPDNLEYALATITMEEKASGLALREVFVASPYSMLESAKESVRATKDGEKRKIERSVKENSEIAQMPDVTIDNTYYQALERRAKSTIKNHLTPDTIKKISAQIQKQQAELKAKRAAEDAERSRLFDEEVARRKAEQQAKKNKPKMSKKQARKLEKLRQEEMRKQQAAQQAQTTQAAKGPQSEKKEEIPLEAVQALRRLNVKIEVPDPIAFADVLKLIYGPIVSGFEYDKTFPDFDKINECFAKLVDFQENSVHYHDTIQASAKRLRDIMYDEKIDDVRTDLFRKLAEKEENGLCILENITRETQFLVERVVEIEEIFKEAASAMNSQTSKTKNLPYRINTNTNLLEQHREICQNILEYIGRIEDKCNEFYGCQPDDFLTEEQAKAAMEYLKKFLNQPLTPTTYNRLELMLCHGMYYEEITRKATRKCLIDFGTVQQQNALSRGVAALNPMSLANLLQTPELPQSLLIQDDKWRQYGFNKRVPEKFFEMYRKFSLEVIDGIPDVKYDTTVEGHFCLVYGEEKKKSGKDIYYIEHKKGSKFIPDNMPEFLFKDMRSTTVYGEDNGHQQDGQ